ncbi:MAG: RNA polymerase sigma factor [Planctomycetes bacterium]|nr:RNA polymerase sigma factor [Planctomycetota bacterium]
MTSAAPTLSAAAGSAATSSFALPRAFDRTAPALYRYFVVRTGGDTHLADDLMQQVWVQAAGSRADVPANESEFWLRGIAKNLLRSHWRKQTRRPAHVPLADPALAAELAERLVSEELPPLILTRREVQEQLLLALTELPASQQELIVGHYFNGRSHADLAAESGLSERAVEGRLYRARQALQRKLQHLDVAERGSAGD